MANNPLKKPGQTTYLITGANRGLGLGLTTALALRPNTVVFAGVRSFSPQVMDTLTSLPVGEHSYVAPIVIDATDAMTAATAAETIRREHGYDYIDVVIANSGIAEAYHLASITPLDAVRKHFEVNTIGPLALFQSFLPLLLNAKNPKFVVISTGAGSIGDMDKVPMPVTAYGSSKAAVNFIVRKIHFENEGLIAFPLHPGWVQTDMGNRGAQAVGMEQAPVTLQQSVEGMLDKVRRFENGLLV